MQKLKNQSIRVIAETKKPLKRAKVWINMSINELAIACNRSVDNVIEALEVLGIEGNFQPRTPISDLKIIVEILKKLGIKAEFTAPPSFKISEVMEKDLIKR